MSETLMAADPIAGEAQVKTYRGASIEELLPQIRADLGPDAVILSRREGLIGGIAGFFQKKCIEIDARPGGPRIDVYDDGEGPDADAAMAEFDGLGAGPDGGLGAPDGGTLRQGGMPMAGGALARAMGSGPAVPGAAGGESLAAGASPGGGTIGIPLPEPTAGGALVAAMASAGPAPAAGGEPAGVAGPATATLPRPAFTEPPEPAEAHPVRNDAATREGLATPAMQQLVGEARPFADLLGEMTAAPDAPAAPAPEPRRVSALREGMVAAGLGTDLAADVVDAVVTNVAPFATPGRLRTLVRNELSLRLPVAPAPGPGRRRLAVVGPAGTGKTAAVARVAAAHAAAGQDVACMTLEPADGGASLRAMLDGTGVKVETIAYDELAVALLAESAQLVLIDTPAAAPSTGVTVESLAVTLRAARVDEIHLAVRAGTASPAAVEMFESLKGLEPNRILVSAAADTSYVGAALDVAIRTSLPIHYVAETVVELAPADPRDLASRVVP
jgi:hypothetical protein